MNILIHIDFARPQEKYIHLRYEITLPKGGLGADLTLVMPSWTPGSYLVRDFAQHVESFAVTDTKSRALSYEKSSKDKWRICPGDAKKVFVTYKIYANALSPRAAYADHTLAFVNGPSVFFYLEGFLDHAVDLRIHTPENWKLAIAKNPSGGSYHFENFDELFDTPILASHEMEIRRFRVKNTNYRLAAFGAHHTNLSHVCRDMKKVIAKQIPIFGKNPCTDYLFQLLFIKGGYGGLEHRASSTNIFDGLSLDDKKRYPILITLLGHEHFHLWNVKRIRPRALGPFDYQRENYTRELWIAEGVTSYYDDHTAYRAGVYSREAYCDVLAENIEKHESGKGGLVNSLSDASFDTWIRFYRPNENSQNTCVSYYLKGGLVMMLLDFEIIHRTQGKKTLDAVMQELYRMYVERPDTGISRDEFFACCSKVTKSDFRKFIADHIDGTMAIDWAKEFKPFGILVKNTGKADKYYLGTTFKEHDGKVLLERVTEGSPAFHSALQTGDELLAINDERIDQIKQIKPTLMQGGTAVVLFSRRGLVQKTTVTLGQRQSFQPKLSVAKTLSVAQKKFLAIFLRR